MEDVAIVEGWTGNLEFRLQDDGVAANLGSDAIAAEACDRRRLPVTLQGDLAVVAATEGRVRLNPDTGDFVAAQSPYELRFRRVTLSGIVYYPSDEAVRVTVRPWCGSTT